MRHRSRHILIALTLKTHQPVSYTHLNVMWTGLTPNAQAWSSLPHLDGVLCSPMNAIFLL